MAIRIPITVAQQGRVCIRRGFSSENNS